MPYYSDGNTSMASKNGHSETEYEGETYFTKILTPTS